MLFGTISPINVCIQVLKITGSDLGVGFIEKQYAVLLLPSKCVLLV